MRLLIFTEQKKRNKVWSDILGAINFKKLAFTVSKANA